ncbi:hypothetical protein FOZ62_019619 [Perkinsus olseni]|uniref:Uncharacterized protein n=1 Tax=Perkinsus olseni TaxID=32597 RepID=A0A7J6Q477_PEROL|nr:hypothetical protein FOZ62_019619 [Perkinsus olseni]
MCSSSLPSDEAKDEFIAGLPPNLAIHPVTPSTTLLIGLSREEKISRQRDGPDPARRSEIRRAVARGAEPRSSAALHVEGGLAARVNRRSGRTAVREKTECSAVRNGAARQQAAAIGVVRHGVNDGESSSTESPQVQRSEQNAETQASEGLNYGLKVTTAAVEAPRPWLTSTGTSTTESPQKKMCDAGTSLFTEELGDAMGLLEHAVTDTFCQLAESSAEFTMKPDQPEEIGEARDAPSAEYVAETQASDDSTRARLHESDESEVPSEEPNLEDAPEEVERISPTKEMSCLTYDNNETADNERASTGESTFSLRESVVLDSPQDCYKADEISVRSPPTRPPAVLQASDIRASQGMLLWKAQLRESIHFLPGDSRARREMLEDIDRLFRSLHSDICTIHTAGELEGGNLA